MQRPRAGRQADCGRATPSGASSRGLGGPARAPGDPGRLFQAPALAAAQGVCGNDTARAAEIPPPDIGWKVEQLVRDNQWRSIAARRGRTARGRGGGAGRGRGTRGRGQTTQTRKGAQRPGGVSHGHTICTRKYQVHRPPTPQRRHAHLTELHHNSL